MTAQIDHEDRSAYFAEPVTMTSSDGVQMKGDRYVLPTNDGLDGKWHPHTRVTTISGVLPNSYGLGIWQADRVAWAMAQRPDLCAQLASVKIDDVATIREVRAKAEIIAAVDEGANLGTATHNVVGRYASGEPIETLHKMFHPDIHAFRQLLIAYGLTVIPGLIERVVRMRDYDIAGRLDYIMQEADGSFVVVDVKTKGDPEKVHEIATQLAPYANADEMYDPTTGRFVPMPPVRRDYALMIHIRPGSGVATIKKIDIRRGLWSVEIAKNALAYSKMTHLATPYVMPSPVKPADAATVARSIRQVDEYHVSTGQQAVAGHAGSVTGPVFDGMVGNGQPDPQQVADTANAVLNEVHARIGSTTPHGVVIPGVPPAGVVQPQQSAASGPTATEVAPPTPAAYGAPAGVTPPPAYVPQTVKPRPEAVLVTTGSEGVEVEAAEIADVFANKSKAVMQAYARRYGITDLNHHKKHIAKSIAMARADRRKAGLDAEPSDLDDTGEPQPGTVTKPRPQTMAETGLPAAPSSPPGQPVTQPPAADTRPDVDLAEQAVLKDIAEAKSVQRIGEIWTLWTGAYGPESWTGNVQAAADAKVAEINAAPVAGPPAGGGNEPPF
jgi:hypothetical protein